MNLSKLGFKKEADIYLGPKDQKVPTKVTAEGIFVGATKDWEAKAKDLDSMLKKHKSIQKTRAAYVKKYPKDYTTVSMKSEKIPKKPIFFGKKKYKAKMQELNQHPKVYLQVFKAGGKEQIQFYNDIARGHKEKTL